MRPYHKAVSFPGDTVDELVEHFLAVVGKMRLRKVSWWTFIGTVKSTDR